MRYRVAWIHEVEADNLTDAVARAPQQGAPIAMRATAVDQWRYLSESGFMTPAAVLDRVWQEYVDHVVLLGAERPVPNLEELAGRGVDPVEVRLLFDYAIATFRQLQR